MRDDPWIARHLGNWKPPGTTYPTGAAGIGTFAPTRADLHRPEARRAVRPVTDEADKPPPTRRILPVVVDMCRRVDAVFVRYTGAVAGEVAKDVYASWLETGRNGPSGVARYIEQLAHHIEEDHQRASFLDEARRAMMNALERRR